MSLKKNIIANYVSQLYVTGIGILILPLYIKYMGAEAYGLIGFFTMLQTWFGLLDLGLTPTISRETSRYFGGSLSSLKFRQLFRALSSIFIFIAVLGGGTLYLLADEIANNWLKIQTLNINVVLVAIQIMAVSVALRWLTGLYRGIVIGAEKLVWLSAFSVVIATLRFLAVFISMYIFGYTPLVFFWHQLAVALLEFSILLYKSTSLLPSKNLLDGNIGWSFAPISSILKFSLSIAFTSAIWVLITQTDKLILSKILTLSEYGYFTLAVLVSSGIMVISGPISSAITPRMANLYAQAKRDEMLTIYRDATQIVSVIAGSVSLIISFYPEQILFIWTGDVALAAKVAPILRLYALGNALLVVGAFPYYLQYALGDLRYHLIGNAIMLVTLIPSIIWAAINYGGIGAGYAWLFMNLFYFVFWVSYVHSKLAQEIMKKWLFEDVLSIYSLVTSFLLLLRFLNLQFAQANRLETTLFILLISLISFTIAVYSSKKLRYKLFKT